MAVQAPKRILADARPTKTLHRFRARCPALGELAIGAALDRDLLGRGAFHELAFLATRRADRGGR